MGMTSHDRLGRKYVVKVLKEKGVILQTVYQLRDELPYIPFHSDVATFGRAKSNKYQGCEV